jgi:glycosyltransferase involved in cell wall biosynthesis
MRIAYIQYTNPAGYPPLEHSSRILAKAGWEVLFLGITALGASGLTFPPHPNVTIRQLPFCQPGLRQKIHYVIYGIWALLWVVRWRPQWLYASDLLACPITLVLSMIPGLRVIYHEHDSPGRESDSMLHDATIWCRKRLAARAACCIVPNDLRAARFREEHPGASVYCVWNCPGREEIAPASSRRHDPEFWALYHGSITPARLPQSVLHAMAMLPAVVKLRIIGYQTIGHRNYLTDFVEEAHRFGLSERLHVVGTLPNRKQLLEWCTRADVGLSLMPLESSDLNERTMAGASNKTFDYLSQGVPVLVSDSQEWRSMFVVAGYGLACQPHDPRSIAAALGWLFEHREQGCEMGERGRQRIAREWNYETQFAKAYAALVSAAQGPVRENSYATGCIGEKPDPEHLLP